MKVCGVELKGNEAIISLISFEAGLYTLLDCRVRKIALANAKSSEDIKKFQFDFAKLMQDYQIGQVVIKERLTKGKFAGGAVSFKLEAAIQLIPNLDVALITNSYIKESLKNNSLAYSFKETGLKQFQEQAFNSALAFIAQQ